MQRLEMLAAIAERLLKIERTHPVRICIDGVTASGKTTLADELAAELTTSSGRQIIRGSVDDFHNPPEVRYRRGRMSPEGYYLDAFDHASLRNLLLDPLGPHRSLHYCVGAFGQPDGTAADFEERRAPDDAILIVDGVFLYRRSSTIAGTTAFSSK